MDNQFSVPENQRSDDGSFKTPEQVASNETQALASPILSYKQNTVHKTAKHKPRKKFWPPNKYVLIVAVIVLLIIVAGGYWLYKNHQPKTSHTVSSTVVKSQTVASSLTGLQVSPATNNLPITAVIVENSPDARPQSGLGEAGVVFEALAEGGITRFMAVYQSDSSTSIGPVRSARPYFISWELGFDAGYAHVGGSPQALTDISQWDVRDLDEFYNASAYQRVSYRQAPHNVYTTPGSLYALEKTKGYDSSSFTSWPRKNSKPLKTPTATSIDMTLSSSDYNVSYTYDKTTNSYNRDNGGSPQIDADTNKQISPKVAIAIVVPEMNGPLDGIGAYYSDYTTVGSGTAYIFQDGGVTVGEWTKASNTSQILFSTSSGQSLSLDSGQVWITAVTSNSAVSYK